jgi:vacuolar-type H+-ATPase subunit D/Vma8
MESVGSAPNVETVADAKAQVAALPQTDLYSNGKTKLVKTVNYRFEVDDVKKSSEAIEQAVKKYPAYISSSDLRLQYSFLENKITIRVQNEYFQELLKEIDKQARFVNFRDVKTNDVAKEFVDLESRLKTKREVEERYAQILRTKAGTIEELLSAEEQIGKLHEEIEATVSRINYLKDQVSYSTINLEFYQTITQQVSAGDEVTRKDEFINALAAGWNGIMDVVLLLAYIWPVLILAGVSVFIFRYFKKKRALSYKQI